MYQSDYILRIIEQFTASVRRMLASLREARPEEALEISDEALGLALDMDPSLVGALDGESLIFLAGMGAEPDPVRLLLVAEILALRCEALRANGDFEAAAREEARVLTIAERALSEPVSERVKEMMTLLGKAYDRPIESALS